MDVTNVFLMLNRLSFTDISKTVCLSCNWSYMYTLLSLYRLLNSPTKMFNYFEWPNLATRHMINTLLYNVCTKLWWIEFDAVCSVQYHTYRTAVNKSMRRCICCSRLDDSTVVLGRVPRLMMLRAFEYTDLYVNVTFPHSWRLTREANQFARQTQQFSN